MTTNLLALPNDCPICKLATGAEVYRANDEGLIGIACQRCGRAYVTFRVFEKISDLPADSVILHRLAAFIRKENLSSRYPHIDLEEWPRVLAKVGIQDPAQSAHGSAPSAEIAPAGDSIQNTMDHVDVTARQDLGVSWWQLYSKPLCLAFGGYVTLLLVLFGYGTLQQTWPDATTAYFLVANLLVLWWYAHTTRVQAEAARTQVAIGQQQYALALRQRREMNKPFVVLEYVTDPDRPGYARYSIRNIGPGVAVNVFHVSSVPETANKQKKAGEARFDSLGALGPAASRVLPEHLEARLRDAQGQALGVALVAEGIATRTARWGCTLNALAPSGQVLHRIFVLEPPSDEEIDRLLDRQWARAGGALLELQEDAKRHL